MMNSQVRLLLSLLALLLTLHARPTPTPYRLSPLLPPTAFVDQYYSCAFRVGGLSKPQFSFSHLPPPLSGSRNGLIEGVPSASGAYKVTVRFQQEDEWGSQEVMLIVALPEYNTSQIRSRHPNRSLTWRQIEVQTVYQLGGVIDINLDKYAPNNKYNWTYLHLPAQLQGDSTGRINGIISQTGYYTFAAICADQDGNSLDQFLTLNIQPLSYDLATNYPVSIQNIFPYDQKAVDEVDKTATEDADIKLQLFQEASNALDNAKKALVISVSNQEKATTQAYVVGQIVKLATNHLAKQYYTVNDMKVKLKSANGVFKLKQTAYLQAQNATKDVQNIFDIANNTFTSVKEALSNASREFITAQTESSQAASVLASALLTQQLANQDVNTTFQTVMDAKQVVQTYTSVLTLLNFNVSTAQNEQGVAGFQNDAATASFNTATSNVDKALQGLQAANSSVFMLQQSLANAKTALGQAQFNLTQAMNNLFLAQSAKEQSDKQLLLASAQSIQLSSLTPSLFSGCNAGNYPSMFGSASIRSIVPGGYGLNSGYSLVYGGCTVMGKYSVGDAVQFQGYLRGGLIHAVRIGSSG